MRTSRRLRRSRENRDGLGVPNYSAPAELLTRNWGPFGANLGSSLIAWHGLQPWHAIAPRESIPQ